VHEVKEEPKKEIKPQKVETSTPEPKSELDMETKVLDSNNFKTKKFAVSFNPK
jgi:hypothetical protein